jgi:hypothetical protein
MTFPANDLEVVLQAAARNETGPTSFVDTLFRSRGYFPIVNGTDGSGSVSITTIDARPFVAVFTSTEQAGRAGVTGSLAEAPVGDFMSNVPAHVGLAVNPGGDLGMPVPADVVQLQIGRATPVPAGTRIRIGEPAEEPVELLMRLASSLATIPAARLARRCWAQVGVENPGLVIGVDVDPDNPDVRAAVIRAVASANIDRESIVNVVFTSDEGEFVSWMSANTEPFFRA